MLARQAGLAPWQAGALSLAVYAGSSQFIAVSLLAAGASVPAIAATTFVVNFRHALMSSALSVHLAGASRRFLALFAHGITDESFALNLARFRQAAWDRHRALIVNLVSCAAWVASSVAGTLAGQLVPRGAAGIDYALPAMFLCLLVFQLRSRLHVWVALLSGALSVGLSLALRGNGHVVLASLLAATTGFGALAAARRGKAG